MNSPDGIITVNEDGVIIFSNPSADRMLGYETLMGKKIDVIVPEGLRDDLHQKMRDYRARGEHELAGKVFETVSLRADGTEFPVEIHGMGSPIAPRGSRGRDRVPC